MPHARFSTSMVLFFMGLLSACRPPSASPSPTAPQSSPPAAQASEATSPTAVTLPAQTRPPSSTPPVPTETPTPTGATWWQPRPRTTWQIQLNSGDVALSYEAQAYDVDLFDTPTETIAQLHHLGRRVICYFSAGSYEDWRPDADRYQGLGLLGQPLEDWPGERFVDIRRLDALTPILQARFDLALAKGCDAVDPDNVQNYLEPTGFDLTYADQLRFNRWLAQQAHVRGLAVGLKNDREQIPDLVDDFDFAVDEECFTYGECEPLLAFIQAEKAVFEIEYDLSPADFCAQANAWGFSALLKPWELGPSRFSCIQDFKEK